MHTHKIISVLFSLLILTVACDDADTSSDDATADRARINPRPQAIPVGALWGECDLTGVNEPGWWGCDGSLGEGLACLRPVSDNGLNICVPQTWDATIDDDCGNVSAPFGLGVRTQGSAYCVADCMSDADCAGGQACSPSSGFCAWIDQ